MSRGRASPSEAPLAPSQPRKLGDTLTWLICAYLLLIVMGFVLLGEPGVMPAGNDLSRDRALFLAVDAATLTGFQLSLQGFAPDSLQGPAVLLMLTLAGTLTSILAGGIAVVRILRLPYSTRQVVSAALVWTLGTLLLGTVFLLEPGMTLSSADILACWQQAASAFGNSGVMGKSLPAINTWPVQVVMLPMVVLGGLGLPVLMEVWDLLRRRRALSPHSRTVLVATGAIYLLGIVCFGWMQTHGGGGLRTALAKASATAINARTAGFSWEFYSTAGAGMLVPLAVLMMIGASPAGTGGGIKTTAIVQVMVGVRRGFGNQSAGRAASIAATWIGLYLLMVAGTFFGLLQTSAASVPAGHLLFEAISAVSNVGLSHERILLVGPGLFVLCGGMIIGRLAPLLILWWMAQTTEDAELAVA